jgi:hypothetical protein
MNKEISSKKKRNVSRYRRLIRREPERRRELEER